MRAAFYGNVGHFDNLIVVEEPSAKAAEIVAEKYGKVDMVFIDASHDEQSVAEDIRLWAPLARKIVAGHDYGYASVQGPVVKYFGRGRDRRCNAIWAMIVEGANMAEIPEIDTNKDATDEDAEKLVEAIPATPVAPVVLPPDVDYTVMAGRPDH